MQLPTIGVLWKNDLPGGFGFMLDGGAAERLREHIEKYLPGAVADLRENPEAKNQLLNQLAWYGPTKAS
jgi:hypothetical protein